MMATIALAGQGLVTPNQIREKLVQATRGSNDEAMAPPQGLCLVEVKYPEESFHVSERSAFDWNSLQADSEILKRHSEASKQRELARKATKKPCAGA